MPRTDGIDDAEGSYVEASPPEDLGSLSDQALHEGIRGGSERHFNELYDRYFDRVYGFVHSRIHNHADAEEIAQEAFLTVFRSIESYRGQASLLSWIFGIAKNLTNNGIRRSQSQRQKLEGVAPEQLGPRPSFANATPEEQLHLQRYTDAIREQLGAVAPWQRRVFEMRHLENLSIPEIACRTDRTSDAIRSSLYRVKRLLLETAGDIGERADP